MTPSPSPATAVELLAPAGDWECLRAAVENGADAVYFGLDCGFNARARAKNFELDDLPRIMEFLHLRGVKGFVTLNTLVFPDELQQASEVIMHLATCRADAVLVQDLGIARLVRAITPDLPIHASTQMTLTSSQCIEALADLDIERAVLARELSISEIDQIHSECNMELEAFAHGALCVAYSGQCLTSESLGGRSANRGQCAQACRLAYSVVCDGDDVELDDVKYLLSPQDLAAYELVPQMIAAGVRCFKIEGRLKAPEYVANITRHYRRAIDAALIGDTADFNETDVREMELSFSRGFSPGWLNGCDHKMLVPGLSSAKRGVLIGKVIGLRGGKVKIQLNAPLAPGDGVVFAGDREANKEQGGRIYQVSKNGQRLEQGADTGTVEVTFNRHQVDLSHLYIGQQLWKTDDPQLTKRLKKSFTGAKPIRKVRLHLTAHGGEQQPLRLSATADNGATCRVESIQPMEKANKHPLTHETFCKQLGRLGDTVYELGQVELELDGAPMLPLSVLGKLRHAMISQLDASLNVQPATINPTALSTLREAGEAPPTNEPAASYSNPTAEMHVLCRTLSQVEACLAWGQREITAEFQDIRQYREAVEQVRAAGGRINLATLRIQKPEEYGLFAALRRHQPDGLLVRNLAALAMAREYDIPCIADFSLNAANELTVDWLREQGSIRVTPSFDLNRDQLLDLLATGRQSHLELVIHQHMPMFHMEHCVFCAVLSPGTNKTNCGRPCDEHQVELRDRIGAEHPLKADIGCRNTLYNAVPQSSAEVVPRLLSAGVQHFRVELLEHNRQEVHETLTLYRQLLDGQIEGNQVWQQLRANNRVGVTRGTLETRRDPLAII